MSYNRTRFYHVSISVSIQSEVKEALTDIAKKEDRRLSQVVSDVIELGLEYRKLKQGGEGIVVNFFDTPLSKKKILLEQLAKNIELQEARETVTISDKRL